MEDMIWSIVILCLWPLVSLGGIWYIISPRSVRKFHKKHRGFDRSGKMNTDTDLVIRLKGILLVLFCVFCEVGLLAAFGLLK